MENKTWKYPVGTQRIWSKGTPNEVHVIKTHDNNIFESIHPAWMTMPTIPEAFKKVFKECDRLGRQIFSYKEPIEGEIWLDKEFESFVTQTGKVFTGAEFKKYSPFKRGTYGFDFYSTLCERYLSDKIALNAKIGEQLVEANDAKIQSDRAAGTNRESNSIVLSEEEIKNIKERARSEFKFDDGEKLVLSDATDIEAQLKEILSYLEKGDDLEGDEKALYGKAMAFLGELERGAKYRSITEVKSDMRAILREMGIVFAKNFGIRESYKKRVGDALYKYIKRFWKNIEDEELQVFLQKTGVDLYSDTTTFYNTLRASTLFEDFNVEDPKYIGEIIQHFNNKYDDLILVGVERNVNDDGTDDDSLFIQVEDPITGEVDSRNVSEEHLERLIKARQVGESKLDVPLKLRFEKLFGKELDGEWNRIDLTTLEVFEKLTQYLPDGHLLTNRWIEKIEKDRYMSTRDGNSYAFFNPTYRLINFSDSALRNAQFASTDINSGVEIASVMIHEIGHSVSQKISRRDSKLYKKFVRDCGWSWEQFQWTDEKRGIDRSNNFTATGNDNDIPRHGTQSNVPLITEYSGKSPEEAFAEYYSFYSQYKKDVDHFLKSGDESVFNKVLKPKVQDSKKSYGDFLKEKKAHFSSEELEEITQRRNDMDAILLSNKRDSSHFKVDIVNPYPEKHLETMEERKVNPALIVTEKNRKSKIYSDNYSNPNPVFTVFNHHTGQHDIIETDETRDAGVHYANKYLRRYSPTYSISKECFNILSDKGYSMSQIRDYTLNKFHDKPIPEVRRKQEAVESDHGMHYAGSFIPSSKLKKMSQIFSSMKEIWESEELKKAIQELFTNQNEDMWEEILSDENTIQKSEGGFFSTFRNLVKGILKTSKRKDKKNFGDSIIFNSKGEILLLQRKVGDKIFSGLWGLPGGHIEESEESYDGAARKLLEETNIGLADLEFYKFLDSKTHPDCIIFYHEGKLKDDTSPVLILDNDEHFKYEWVSLGKLDEYQMIEGLKETLLSLPYELTVTVNNPQPLEMFQSMNVDDYLDSLFNDGVITEIQYFEHLQDFSKAETEEKKKDYKALLQKMYERKGLDENGNVKGEEEIEKSFDAGELSTEDFFKSLSTNN